jgi:5-(carboxyamino)imidazole ribonucleotide mutase
VIDIRSKERADEAWVRRLMVERWGATNVVVHGRRYYPAELPGFVAVADEERLGLVTYHLAGDACEIVTLDSLRPSLGIGTALMDAVKEAAASAGCGRLWLITTNDNLTALRFYQKRGFHLVTVHPEAVNRSRALKPEIARFGQDGIPIRDEIELEILLPTPLAHSPLANSQTRKLSATAGRHSQPLKDPTMSPNQPTPLVGVIMGSTSDWETMRHATEILAQFDVPHETRVVSAHRTPVWMADYAGQAEARGLEVIIAGAGGAAHLPGMVAAHTLLPVLGVPVQSQALNGLDSLLSIVQMPGGVPVGTMAIGKAGATNAALLAMAILGNKYPQYRERLRRFREEREQQVRQEEIS